MRKDKKLGIYIHIPFCRRKCPYCDFYSLSGQSMAKKYQYARSVINEIKLWAKTLKALDKTVDSVYFGGGTPALLDSKRLCLILEAIRDNFNMEKDCEITIEMNPNMSDESSFKALKKRGLNRVSIGMQSVIADEICLLGRRHSVFDVSGIAEKIRSARIDNISFDVMVGIQKQNLQTLKSTLDFAIKSDVQHISAYMLKIEKNTQYFRDKDRLLLPSEKEVAQLYTFLCGYLSRNGFHQYEISNFAKQGYESYHNRKYWNCDDYLGIGASAHSCINGVRFFTKRDLEEFLQKPKYLLESNNEEILPSDLATYTPDIETMVEEYIMLRLRLTDGLNFSEFYDRFGFDLPQKYKKNINALKGSEFINIDKSGISLTTEGFLLSNTIISKILYD